MKCLYPNQHCIPLFAAAALTLLLLSGCTFGSFTATGRMNPNLAPPGSSSEDIDLPAGQSAGGQDAILAKLTVDLDADGQQEEVYVVGEDEPENPMEWSKTLVIADDAGIISHPLAGKEALFPLAEPVSLITQQVPEGELPVIGLMTDPRGNGGKGIHFLHLFRWSGEKLVPAALSRRADPMNDYDLIFAGDRTYQVTNRITGETWSIPVPREGPYPPEGIDPDSIQAALFPEHAFYFSDTDGDGRDELIGRQILTGIAHVDIIADLVTIYKWDGRVFRELDNRFEQDTPQGRTVVPPSSRNN